MIGIIVKNRVLKVNEYSFLKEVSKICITGGSGFIGSNLIRIIKNISKTTEILNLDIRPPKNESQKNLWQYCDLNNEKELFDYIKSFEPNYIIHLAAEATTFGKTLNDYKTNIDGVKNLINVVKTLSEKVSIIFVSSQHVKKPGTFNNSNINEYSPLGLYGQSKVITEELVKKAKLKQNWFIVRPTLVWGPGNLIMAESIFKYIHKDIYYHPKNDNTVRSYGYVDNVCYQMLKLCSIKPESLDTRILYVADGNILQKEWIYLACKLMDRGETKTVPKFIIEAGSYIGDFIKYFYPKFPLYKERYFNLTTSNPVSLSSTFSLLGKPKIGLYKAMVKTTCWIKDYYDAKK